MLLALAVSTTMAPRMASIDVDAGPHQCIPVRRAITEP
ncbi:Uncharacterised protein [Mycobacterium tuberculosis]|uniref:Uncharacterized protein n=1 Tax=Mycobacterium tuberculosis TaxID=1773 RepID=A0A655FIR3_MYCTX